MSAPGSAPGCNPSLVFFRDKGRDLSGKHNRAVIIDNRNDSESDTAYKGGAGVELGWKVACRGSRKNRQAKAEISWFRLRYWYVIMIMVWRYKILYVIFICLYCGLKGLGTSNKYALLTCLTLCQHGNCNVENLCSKLPFFKQTCIN